MRTRQVIEQLLRKFKVTLHLCRSKCSCVGELLTLCHTSAAGKAGHNWEGVVCGTEHRKKHMGQFYGTGWVYFTNFLQLLESRRGMLGV